MSLSTETKIPAAFIQSRLISFRQTMELLGCGRTKLTDLVKNEKDPLPSVRIGGSRMFQLDKVLWWIEKHAE